MFNNIFYNYNQFKFLIGKKVYRSLLLSIISGLFWFAIESSFVIVIQSFLLGLGLIDNEQSMLPKWYPTDLKSIVLILIMFGFVRAIAITLKTYIAQTTQSLYIREQRSRLFQYVMFGDGKIPTSQVLTLFNEVVSQTSLVVFHVSILVTTIVSAFFFFIYGLFLTPFQMIIGVLLLSIFILPLRFLSKKVAISGKGLFSESNIINEKLIRGIKNNFILKIYNRLENEFEEAYKSLSIYHQHYVNYSLISGIVAAYPMFIGITTISFITYLSKFYYDTQGVVLVSFFYIFIRLAQSASEANATISNIKFNSIGFESLLKVFDSDGGMYLKKERFLLGEKDNFVFEMKNVSFGYSEQECIIKNLNLKISNNQVLVIKGASGTGKSTLLSLIFGAVSPRSGEILINGKLLNNKILDFSNNIAYVGPEPYLISGSIRDNLLYGLNDVEISENDLWASLSAVGMVEVIKNLNNGLDHKIADNVELSTGQKQRLSFARALLRNPKLLILDEATANIDSDTENNIIENLKRSITERTIIIVTHKDSFDNIGTNHLNLNKI